MELVDVEKLRDAAIVLIVNQSKPDHVVTALILAKGATPDEAAAILADARQRIASAADFKRDEQIAIAIKRFEDIYAKAIAKLDTANALKAQKELVRLMDLNRSRPAPAGEDDSDELEHLRHALDMVGRYLLPLNLVDKSYPIEEHARAAADVARRAGAAK